MQNNTTNSHYTITQCFELSQISLTTKQDLRTKCRSGMDSNLQFSCCCYQECVTEQKPANSTGNRVTPRVTPIILRGQCRGQFHARVRVVMFFFHFNRIQSTNTRLCKKFHLPEHKKGSFILSCFLLNSFI